jgi:undecaprenyl-diphosphatase
MTHLTYLEAAVVGLVQGVSELFPVSSLGHNVLIPALVGGSWARDLNVADANSPYLAFIVGMHVATAIALLIYFWRDWVRIIGGFFSSIRHREVQTRDQRMAWMIILATIPVGLVGVVADKPFREIFGKPIVAGVFLIINGVILYCGERFRPASSVRADQEIAAQRQQALMPAPAGVRRQPVPAGPGMARQARHASGQQAVRQEELVQAVQADERLSRMGYLRAVIIGTSQIFALLAGISRDGITMVTGMSRGLSREDAARFAFLLATPVILAAGVLELPKLTGPEGNGIHGQILLGSILSGVGAYVSVRFLMRYFQTRTLTPFAIYCFVFGLLAVVYLGFIK